MRYFLIKASAISNTKSLAGCDRLQQLPLSCRRHRRRTIAGSLRQVTRRIERDHVVGIQVSVKHASIFGALHLETGSPAYVSEQFLGVAQLGVLSLDHLVFEAGASGEI
jgi:hypothetical protein